MKKKKMKKTKHENTALSEKFENLKNNGRNKGKMDTPNTHILSWLCRSTCVTSIKSSRVKLVLCTSNLNEIFASVFHT
jgi:hypothetical protein